MQVSQLLHPLTLAPDIEVMIPRLPKRRASRSHTELLRNYLLHHLQRHGEASTLRFTHQKMDVLGHHHIANNEEAVPLPYFF